MIKGVHENFALSLKQDGTERRILLGRCCKAPSPVDPILSQACSRLGLNET